MNLKQFKYVLVLANEGSFSRAANVLNISQPSLSQYIKKIEAELGMELFDRRSGIVRITDAGRVYIETGRKILDLEHQMQCEFQDITENKSGSISVGIADHRSVCLMPQLAAAFRERYPGFCLTVDERTRGPLLDAAEHGEFDLCVTTRPVNEAVFHTETLFHEEIMVAVPKTSHICSILKQEQENGKIDLALLDGSDFVMLCNTTPMCSVIDTIISEYDLHFCKTVECTSLQAALSMVSAGMGVTLVPACLRSIASNNVEFFSIAQDIPRREIIVIYRKEQHLSQAIMDCKELMKQVWN